MTLRPEDVELHGDEAWVEAPRADELRYAYMAVPPRRKGEVRPERKGLDRDGPGWRVDAGHPTSPRRGQKGVLGKTRPERSREGRVSGKQVKEGRTSQGRRRRGKV